MPANTKQQVPGCKFDSASTSGFLQAQLQVNQAGIQRSIRSNFEKCTSTLYACLTPGTHPWQQQLLCNKFCNSRKAVPDPQSVLQCGLWTVDSSRPTQQHRSAAAACLLLQHATWIRRRSTHDSKHRCTKHNQCHFVQSAAVSLWVCSATGAAHTRARHASTHTCGYSQHHQQR